MIHLESWYREASLERDLLRLEESIRAAEGDVSEWVRVQDSGLLEKAWVLSERLGTLPQMDRQQAEYADEQTGYSRVFSVQESERDMGLYFGDPEGEWVELSPQSYNLPDILEELRHYHSYNSEEGCFLYSSVVTFEGAPRSVVEHVVRVEGLDQRGHRVIWMWAQE